MIRLLQKELILKMGININIVENGKINKDDVVLNGPDGARIIVSGLDKKDHIKELLKDR